MAYATFIDVQDRMTRTMSSTEVNVCRNLLDDAAVIIDGFNEEATDEVKKIVSIRVVQRALGDGSTSGIPIGASQGSMSGLGYAQSWTMTNGSTGELYLSKLEKEMLGRGNKIGSHSPVEELVHKEA